MKIYKLSRPKKKTNGSKYGKYDDLLGPLINFSFDIKKYCFMKFNGFKIRLFQALLAMLKVTKLNNNLKIQYCL